MPSARMLPAGSLAFTWSDLDPYQRGSVVAYPFSFLEASYQYTDINNALYSDVEAFSGSQTYKDKGFDVKIRIIEESRYLPAVALGARDIAGTGIFSSEYIVASKQFGYVDFTFGLGWGVISDSGFSNPLRKLSEKFAERQVGAGNEERGGKVAIDSFFTGQVGIFGGVEYLIPNARGARFKLEYDSTDYEKEGFPFGKDSFKFAFENVRPQDSKFNYGFTLPVNNNLHLKLNFIKGNTISFGFSFKAPFGGKDPFITKKDFPKKIPNADIIKKVNKQDRRYVYRTSLKYLLEEGVSLQKANIEDDVLHIAYTQSKHFSLVRSAGRAVRVLDSIVPDDINYFKLSNINADMGMNTLTISRDIFNKYEKDKIYPLAVRNIKIEPYNYTQSEKEHFEFQPRSNFPSTFWSFQPNLRQQIGGPDGFYFGELRLGFNSETLFAKNITWLNSISYGVYNNFDDLKLASESVLPHVRTDIVSYLKESRNGVVIERSQLNLFKKLGNNFYSKFAIGIFEPMFAGYGGEVLYRNFHSNWGIGAEIWQVKQRDYDQQFNFLDYETLTGHINFFYREPKTRVLVALKGGKFLAKDSGINFDFSRRFKSGLILGAFFSLTDISADEFGEGSFDKGFYFHIPIEVFSQTYKRGYTGFGLRPVTRDGAQFLTHGHHLWGVSDQSQKLNITVDLDDIYD